ncbi:hypothetical protein ACFQPF_02645 [Fictibacillus iocasae]|uniref:NEAT domain-containing protein n=1 Tax=Fictibacillus iocasae TaxID=2715437 RepID=A0ABW2NM82_9BACL
MGRKIVWALILLACFAAVSTYATNKNIAEKTDTDSQKMKYDAEMILFKGENDYWEASMTESEDAALYMFSLKSKEPDDNPDALTFSLSHSVQSFAEYTLKAAPFPSRLSFAVSKKGIEINQPVIVKITGKHTSQYFQMHYVK